MCSPRAYSGARSVKPGGGGGSSMCSTSRPQLGHHVDVAGQRAVHERAGRRRARPPRALMSSARYGPDPPVLLVEDVVVDPAAPRRLEQRVVEEEEEAPARRRARGPSRRSPARTASMCSRTRHMTTASKAPVGERQRVGVGPGVDAARRRAARLGDLGRRSGRRPTTDRRRARSTGGRAGPHRSRRRARAPCPARCRSTSGRICSSYSGSAPSVNSSLPPPGVRLPGRRVTCVSRGRGCGRGSAPVWLPGSWRPARAFPRRSRGRRRRRPRGRGR